MTTAQRARLVVAMGLLNLILATVALTAGVVAPTPSTIPGDVAGVTGSPAPTATLPEASPGASGSASTPAPSGTAPSAAPSSSLEPSPAVSPSVAPSEGPIVAIAPTPTPPVIGPSPTATPIVIEPAQPTPHPTAQPTPRPTVRPTATPQPAKGVTKKARPPCPGGDGPPGHHKVTPPPARPCSSGNSQRGSNGIIVALPLALTGLVASTGRRTIRGIRRLGPGRSARRRARRMTGPEA